MTVLGRGDLSPPRRHHRRRGGRWLALLLLVTLAVGGWFAWQWWQGRDEHDSVRTAPTPCRTSSPPPEPAAAKDVRVWVLNGTRHDGLAHDVAAALRHRGFHVVRVGNATKPSRETAILSFREDLAAVFTLRANLQQFQWVPTLRKGAPVTLLLGRDFTGLLPTSRAAERLDVARRVAHPTTPPCTSSTANS